MHKKPAILFVVHKGKLESQALLLAASLRFYNEDTFDLIACIPTQSGGIASGVSESVRTQLGHLNVQFVEVDNPIGSEYLIGNKLNCLSATSHNTRTFLDTDMVCISPLQLPQLQEREIAVKPADRKTYGWSDEQWEKAYLRYADYRLTEQDQLMSTCFRELMWPYFNAGLIHISGCPEFSQTWSNISKELDEDVAFQNKRPWLDQLSLPLAIKKLKLKTHCLTEEFNFPANIKAITNERVSLVHYHRPELVANNRILLSQTKTITLRYDWLLPALSKSPEWDEALIRLNELNIPEKLSAKEYLLTEIPHSGLDEVGEALDNIKGVDVFNNPLKVTKPISRRQVPWGIGLFFEKKQVCSPPLNHVVVSIGVSLLTSIRRVKQVKPQTIIVACINDPIKTTALWSIEYILTIIESDDFKYLNVADKQLISRIVSSNSEVMKKALFWCFCANQLLKEPSIKLIYADELINKSKNEVKYLLSNQFSLKSGFVTVVSNKLNISMNADERLISNVTSQVYKDLLDRIYTQRSAD